MTDMLEEAIAKIRTLPAADQDEAAAMLLSVASRNDATVALDAQTRAAIREGREQARRGEFVPDEEIDELRKRHRV
jgi:predicted transcriptional regulator